MTNWAVVILQFKTEKVKPKKLKTKAQTNQPTK